MIDLVMHDSLTAVPVATLLILLIGLLLHEELRTKRTRNLLTRISRISVEWDPQTEEDASIRELEKYLAPGRERVGYPGDDRFLLRLPRLQVLQELSEGAKPLPWASIFTGFSLLCTFALIAWVLMTSVREAIGHSNTDVLRANEELSNAVSGMGAKFIISATGVLCAVIYTLFSMRKEIQHVKLLDYAEREMRHVFASPEDYDGLLQRFHLEVLQNIHEQSVATVGSLQALQGDVQRLNSIEVSVQNLSTDVTEQLRHILTRDVGDQIGAMMGKALERIDGIATATQERIVANLDAIRIEISRQAQAPVETLLNQLNSALSQGYSGETAQLNTALQQFARVVPEMARNLDAVGQRLVTTVEQQQGRGEASAQRVFERVDELLQHLRAHQTATSEEFSRMRGDTIAATAKVATLHGETLESLEKRLGAVVGLFSGAEDALTRSAGALKSAAGEASHMIGATEGAVGGLRRVTDQLALQSASVQQILEQTSAVVKEAKDQSLVEVKLTADHRQLISELQSVWPTLLETYIRSFEDKSNQLAASWSDLHEKVRQLADSTTSQWRVGAEELEDAVGQLTKALKDGRQT